MVVGWLHRWNEEFELLVHDPEHEMMTCVLMNKSNFGADEEIGQAEVHHPFLTSWPPCLTAHNPEHDTKRSLQRQKSSFCHLLGSLM